MLDLKYIRENAAQVKTAIKNKNEKADVDEILELDEKKRRLQFDFDRLRAEQNRVSKEIGTLKKNKQNADVLLESMKELAEQVKNIGAELNGVGQELENALLRVPNLPAADVPVGKDENANAFVREWGTKKQFSFVPKDHLALAEQNRLLEMNRGAKITGSGFPIYYNQGSLLERALISFMLDTHVLRHGYTELWVPFAVNRKAMTGTGQLPKLENDMYYLQEEDFFLIPTAEVPVTNFYNDEILAEQLLPQKFVAYTPCFRREAGSYGKETKGLQRLHQFNKVEMVRFVKPEDSYRVLEEMVNNAEAILQALGLHYRVIKLCTGDTSFASAKTYDLEVWAPGAQKYLEVSSVSNFEDFQARRAGIRFRDNDGKVKFVHTLNGSGLATPRTFIAVLETMQNEDGSITVPEVLRPYMRNIDTLKGE